MTSIQAHSRDEAATRAIASAVAGRLRKGDVVLLDGALGSGKTAFVQAAARALGSPDYVTSPTFGIAHFYASEAGSIIHVDTFRLKSLAEFRDLGLGEYLEGAITFIEWGASVSSDFPGALTIEIETLAEGGDGERRLSLRSSSERWRLDLQSIEAGLAASP